MQTCIFAGTFDPLTKGHTAIIKKLKRKYGKVIVVLGENADKTPFFSESERKEILLAQFKKDKKIKVVLFSEIEDYALFIKEQGAKYYVRGIRDEKDLQYEKKYEEINKKLYPEIETVYLNAKGRYGKISSSLVRDKLNSGEYFGSYVPYKAYKKIIEILIKRQGIK